MAAVLITGTSNEGSAERGPRKVFRLSDGTLYWIGSRDGASKLTCWKSTDNGANWAKQGNPGPACNGTFIPSADIKASGAIGVLYASDATTYSYVEFDPGTDAWGAPEAVATVTSISAFGSAFTYDSAGKPHICFIDGTSLDLFYANKVGAGWTNPAVTIHTSARWPDIIVNGSDIPIVSYVAYNNPTQYWTIACLGDQNNATTFTQQTVSNSGADNYYRQTSLAINSNGDVIIARANSIAVGGGSALTVDRHLVADAWGTWQAEEVVDATAQNRSPSLAVKGTDIYLICEKTSATAGIWYYKYTAAGGWEAAVTVETDATGNLQCPKFRWGELNNPSYNSYYLDYIFFDNGTTEQYWNYIDIADAVYKGMMFPRSW